MYTIHMQVQFDQTKTSVIDIIALFSAFSLPIFKFELAKVEKNTMLVSLEGEVSNPAKLAFLLDDLYKHHSSLQIISKFIS